MYDVAVIGGGVVGTMILKELSHYNLRAILFEKEDDVSTGASRANSGIVHAGYDCKPNTNKAKFNVWGNKIFKQVAKELNTPFQETGSIVVGTKDQLEGIKDLYEKGIENGVKVKIIDRKRIIEIEPNVADDIEYALWAEEAAIVSPYKLTIHAADFAISNGAEVLLNAEVTALSKKDNYYLITTTKGEYKAKYVINSAGPYAVDINKMLNDEIHETIFRRGDYFVLDKKELQNINTVIFPLPDEKGKGILVAPTADGNVLYGPTSVVTDRENVSVCDTGLNEVREGVAKTYKKANFRNVIRIFAGMRAGVGDDFIIKESDKNEGYFMLLGIASPGLTSAPAIALHVAEWVKNKTNATKKDFVIPLKKAEKISQMSKEELNTKIKENSRWGRVICRCEQISEQEIIEAINAPLRAETIDAIKRRTRAGMGRCQGGFCMPTIISIVARELNIPINKVKLGGNDSEIIVSYVKEAKYDL